MGKLKDLEKVLRAPILPEVHRKDHHPLAPLQEGKTRRFRQTGPMTSFRLNHRTSLPKSAGIDHTAMQGSSSDSSVQRRVTSVRMRARLAVEDPLGGRGSRDERTPILLWPARFFPESRTATRSFLVTTYDKYVAILRQGACSFLPRVSNSHQKFPSNDLRQIRRHLATGDKDHRWTPSSTH